jgi:type IV pilus assembly protein PilW
MRFRSLKRPALGFSLAELMVALTIGLLIMAGLTTLFVRNTRAQGEIEKANRQVENGRFAIDTIATDLRNAGYYGEFNPTVLPPPATLPAPCDVTVAGLNAGLALPVQGIDQNTGVLDCLSDQKPDTDVLVVRRTSTCVAGAPGCDAAVAGLPYFQASLCSNPSELNGVPTDRYRLDTDQSRLDRRQRNCTQTAGTGTLAVTRRYLTHIYYIAKNNDPGDDIPTLKRAELDLRNGVLAFNVVPLAEGIESLQLEYGLDLNASPTVTPPPTSPVVDGIADTFTAAPARANGCTTQDCAVTNWQSAVAVKVHLLAMNPNPSPGFDDKKIYVLGNDAHGDPIEYPPPKDSRKRHVFESLVTLPNPAGRRQP